MAFPPLRSANQSRHFATVLRLAVACVLASASVCSCGAGIPPDAAEAPAAPAGTQGQLSSSGSPPAGTPKATVAPVIAKTAALHPSPGSSSASQPLVSHSAVLTAALPTTGAPAQPASEPAAPLASADQAIQAVQSSFPEVAGVRPLLTPEPFQGDRVVVHALPDRWELIFVHGTGDCAVGCLSTYYWYFTVWPDGRVEKAGEFSRVFDPSQGQVESGAPLWGVPPSPPTAP